MNLIKRYKSLNIKVLSLIFSSVITHTASAQLFGGDQNPLSVRWRTINTEGFKIIYPLELEKEAQRMANTIPHIFPYEGSSLGVRKSTLPIVLQNRGVIANGFVQLGPKKSEFNTTPPQQFDSQDWLNNLAVHELRHAAQFDLLTGGKRFPFPENIYFAWMGVSIPLWFFEGDAVVTETALTQAGRGRQPSWIMPFRASLLNGKTFSYSKANFGSNKDVTPGYYQLGYLLSSNIRSKFGKHIFETVLRDIKEHPVRAYPFSNSLKTFTGMGTKSWYDSTTVMLKKEWEKQDRKNPVTAYQVLNKPVTFATNYFLPATLPDGDVIALKESKAETRHFVRIDRNRNEEKLFAIGYQEQPWFSYSNGILVWDEIRYDPRYRQRSYSIICSYNLQTNAYKKLSSRSRLFSPTLSSDGTKIVAVQVDLSNQFNLVELDAASGKITFKFPNPNNLILQTPAYDATGKLVTFIGVSEKGKSLWTIQKNGEMTQYIRETNQQLSKPVFMSQGIAFNAHYSGLDNIYYLDLNSREISALSAAKFGAFNPALSTGNKEFVFNNYTVNGHEVARMNMEKLPVPANDFVFFGEAAKAQEMIWNVFKDIPDSSYVSKPYRQATHLFNVHSIIPVIENEYVGGIQLQSNDLLNTTDFYAGVNYHRDLKRFAYKASVSFKSLYPIITASYENRPGRTFYRSGSGMKQGDWRENVTALTARVPINLNALDDTYSLSTNIGTNYTQRYALENLPKSFTTRLNLPVNYGFTFSHSIRQAERDIAPRWGQIVRLKYFHQPFDAKLQGTLFSAEGFLYFPGLFENHSFLANMNYQEASGVRRFNTEINTVYGYNNILAKSRLTNTLLFNYRFPLAFPEAELGPLAYIKNIRGGLFLHYENVGRETNLSEPKTFGFELHGGMHLLRYEPLFDLGTRVVFVNQIYRQKAIFEFMINYTF